MSNKLSDKKGHVTQFIHYLAAVTGGFIGCYAVMQRSDFFGNAQTSNMLYLVLAILGRTPKEIIIRAVGVGIYILGTMSFVFVKKCERFNTKMISLIINTLSVLVLAFIPKDINPILGLYPIFFAMSFQWNAFPGAYGYASSTIFSTNNVRQVSLSFAEYILDGKKEHLHKLFFFLGTIIGFHIGVAFAYICVSKFLLQAIWFALLPIFITFIAVMYENSLETAENVCKVA